MLRPIGTKFTITRRHEDRNDTGLDKVIAWEVVAHCKVFMFGPSGPTRMAEEVKCVGEEEIMPENGWVWSA